jgi:hypothetical protein
MCATQEKSLGDKTPSVLQALKPKRFHTSLYYFKQYEKNQQCEMPRETCNMSHTRIKTLILILVYILEL